MASPSSLHLILFFLLASFASSTTLSNDMFKSRILHGRTLLQPKTHCPVDIENLNYTIITSQCIGPNYQAKACCRAFKELACPFSAELNDLRNDCATTFFSYINVYGKYPAGLFTNLCREGKKGIKCDQVVEPKSKQQQSSNAALNQLVS